MNQTSGDVIPDKICSRCGSGLVAVAMDVGYVEALCPECELHIGWKKPVKSKSKKVE